LSDKLIIAVDPGVVTGLAFWDGEGKLYAYELPEDNAIDYVFDELDGYRRAGSACLVVCEDFVPRGGALTWYPESLHQIGALKHHCRRNGVPFRLQAVKDAKGFSTDAKLKRFRGGEWYRTAMEAYRPGITSHPQAIDAVRHLLLAGVKIGLVDGGDLL
jgi:hypothetical protein